MPQCPKCRIPLCRVELSGVPVHTCSDCGGELIEELRLKAIERRGDPAWTESRKDELCRLADESNNLDDVICPRCSRVMRKFLFRNYANLQLDQCPECKSYWLDPGEMEKMQILWQETRANMTEEDWVAMEAKGALLAHMEARQVETEQIVEDAQNSLPSTRNQASTIGAGLAGSVFGTVAKLMHMNRRLEAMDEEPTEQATFDIADGNSTSSGHSLRQLLPVLLMLGLLILAALATMWLVGD